MPAFYPEGDDPRLGDAPNRSLQKINSLLKSIDTKTGSTTITGPVTVSNEVEVTNSTGNPIPVSGTVSLDSTSLAALENISVTFPATQNVNVTNAGLSVSVSNLPTTQPVSGSVSVSNFPATQPVSLASVPSHPVTGTFWQATQPVSLASAPVTPVTDNGGSLTVDGTVTVNDMTSGNAKTKIVDSVGADVSYITAGTAGTPSAGVLSVQGISGGEAVFVVPDGPSLASGIQYQLDNNGPITRPEDIANGIDSYINNISSTFNVYDSGTVSALGNQSNNPATSDIGVFSIISLIKRGLQNWTSLLAKIPALVSGRIPVDGSGVTQPISASSLPLPSGASTAAKQPALGTAGTPSSDVITVQGASAGTALNTKETQPTGDYVLNAGTVGSLSLSGSAVSTAGFDAGTTADYIAVNLEGGGTVSAGFFIDASTDNVTWVSGVAVTVYYDLPATSSTDAYSYRSVGGQLFGGTRSGWNGRFIVPCTQSVYYSSGSITYRYFRITAPASYGSWRYKFVSYKSPVYSIGVNPGGITRVNGRVDVGYVSGLPTLSATVTQATATNLKTQAETYQGGTAVGSSNPLQVTLANTAANATAVKVDGSAVTQPVSIASAPVTPVTDNNGSLTVDGTVTSRLADGAGNNLTSVARGSERALSVQIVDASGAQVTTFGGGGGGGTVTTTPQQGTIVASTTFTSTTASSSVIAASATRKGLTVYNAGFGDLYICAGATCTTTSFQLKLVSGDYWECPPAQVTLAHAGVYATAGTAYVTTIT